MLVFFTNTINHLRLILMIFMYPNVMLGIACIRLLWALSYALVMHTLHTYDGDWGGGDKRFKH